ncbi:hypothetical protein BCR37DRAFT_392647 [Protomyces lactucae-debilis]|uniref:GH16 domain-containing protein n=1 Tax=Protomyces lactucae-debilis TaxID=2754530 RepID=A0A1Y2FFP0_PROLT|nr:uncharacterized protein BCR37DRAFT_392647 [Protomyces lactucae-debilis]ORY82427.1 hypothetical protein BCR37DRAFT_392647 [Protomyces lactucae-debilis]
MQVLDGAAQLRDWDSILQTDGSFEGSFDQAVDSDHVAWVADSMLHIRPTWIDETPGDSQAVPHVQTAKLRSKASVTFGKARVTAKFPKGDWLWSTISLEPAEDSYGSFPGSGRIDLAQIRGNGRGFLSGGIDKADHLIHYGAAGILASDCAYKDRNVASLGVTDFGAGFHTFGDLARLSFQHHASLGVPRGFWRKTGFSLYLGGDPRLTYSDPWTNGTRAAPFDVAFHLVIRVNAGSVGGIFADVDEKPWYDAAGREAAMHNFNLRNQTWRSTWGKPEQHTLQIKSAMMFQQLSADSSWAS